MTQPVPYVPATSFIGYQAQQPWFPGQNIDIDLNALKTTTDQIRTNLALIQRDDGALANGIVTTASLDPILGAAFGQLPPITTVLASVAAAAASATASAASATSSAASATTATTQAGNASTSAVAAAASAALATNGFGFGYTWSTNTASSDPGSGGIKGNNATISSISAIYLSETDANANALAAIIADFGTSTSANKAVIKIAKNTAPATVWAEWYVTAAITDNGAWDTLTVTYKAGSGAFSNADAVTLSSVLVGDKGTAGAGTVSGLTNHGVVIATSSTGVGNTIVLTDGQILVGATGADPTGKTLSGDATLAATGALTLANSSGTRTNLGLAIGTDVQAFDAQLSSLLRQNSKSAAYTTVLTDAGKHIYHPNTDTTARIFTIDSNANVAYPIGTVITFINDTSAPGTVTIALTSDTLVFAPSGTTGSRTLAVCGVATAVKVNTTRWVISGVGLS